MSSASFSCGCRITDGVFTTVCVTHLSGIHAGMKADWLAAKFGYPMAEKNPK